MNCKFCTNYMSELDRCKYCHFEFDEEYSPYKSDDWDILNLDESGDWEHIQIRDRDKKSDWSALKIGKVSYFRIKNRLHRSHPPALLWFYPS